MSPQAGFVIQDQIVPRLQSAIPKVVHCVGSEDHPELIQDSIAMAAKMLNNVKSTKLTFSNSSCRDPLVIAINQSRPGAVRIPDWGLGGG